MSERAHHIEYYHPTPEVETQLAQFRQSQEAYRQQHPDWNMQPRLFGATAQGLLVAVDHTRRTEGTRPNLPCLIIWMGPVDAAQDIKAAPIFSALTDMLRDGSGIVGSERTRKWLTDKEALAKDVSTLRQWEADGKWSVGIAEGYERFRGYNAQYGQLYLPSFRSDEARECPAKIDNEVILPIADQNFYVYTPY